jgi:putative ABC transport system permease protein
MLRLAILSARGRLGTFTGALVALLAASVLAMAWGARLRLASTEPARTVTVVGVARPRHGVSQQAAIFLTDAEATRLAGDPGRVDAIGVLAAPGLDSARLRAAAPSAQVLTGDARGRAEYPELDNTRTTLIPVTAALGGLALFIAMFVVASTLGLSIQQREREIALLRAVAATPGQIRRLIAWEAVVVALIGSAAGIWPGLLLGRTLAGALVRHGIAPQNFALHTDWLPAAAVIGCAVATSRLAVLAAGRRAARVPPTVALTDATVEPRLLGPGRIIGGLLALAGAVPLFTVSTTTSTPETAAATSELTAIFLVVAVGFLGPIATYVVARLLGPALAAISPVGGFLASANLATATRRFSSASTPLVLRRPELHPSVQHDHHRARHPPPNPRGPDEPAGRHHRRPRIARRRAGRRPRDAGSALRGRVDGHHARSQPRQLR